jgi:uncharacterized protein YbaR (Trm112 family)
MPKTLRLPVPVASLRENANAGRCSRTMYRMTVRLAAFRPCLHIWRARNPHYEIGDGMALDQRLLEILVCPKCKGKLDYRASDNELVCTTCRLRYEVRDDIPIMLVDEAKPL